MLSGSPWLVETLVKRGADPNLRVGKGLPDGEIRTVSGEEHTAPEVKALIRAREGQTPLVFFLNLNCWTWSTATASSLLKAGADPTIADKWGVDAVAAAAANNHVQFLEDVFSFERPEWTVDWGRCSRTLLLDEGLGPSRYQINAFQRAAEQGNIETLEFFRDHDLVPATPVGQESPLGSLHLATMNLKKVSVAWLLEFGEDVNTKDVRGRSALHHAVGKDSVDLVQLLLQNGAKIFKDSFGESPLEMALRRGNRDIVDTFKIASDPVVNSRDVALGNDSRLVPALQMTVVWGDLDGCKNIVGQASSSSILDADLDCGGCSLLLLAASHHNSDLVTWLLDEGASTTKVTCIKHRRLNLLQYALREGFDDPVIFRRMVRLFFEQGGDLYVTWASMGPYLGDAYTPWDPDGLRLFPTTALSCLRVLIEEVLSMNHLPGTDKWARLYRYEYSQEESEPLLWLLGTFTGRSDIVDLFLDFGAGEHEASLSRGQDAMQTLFRAEKHYRGYSAASPREVVDLMHKLCESMSSVNVRTHSGDYPLMTIGAESSEEDGYVEMLLKAGADPRLTDMFDDNNVLHYAVANMNPSFFARMAQAGADPHHANLDDESAMQLAILQPIFVPLLLAGDFHVEDTAPISARTYRTKLRKGNNTTRRWWSKMPRLLEKRLGHATMMRILNLEPTGGWSPLCYFASLGYDFVVRKMLELDGLNPDHVGSPDGPALVLACKDGRAACAKALARAGASYFWARPEGGVTTAVQAAQGMPTLVRWLLVERHTEQPKIAAPGSGPEEDTACGWGGPVKVEYVISGHHERMPDESLMKYLFRLHKTRRAMSGTVVPLSPARRTCRSSKRTPWESVRIHSKDRRAPREAKEGGKGEHGARRGEQIPDSEDAREPSDTEDARDASGLRFPVLLRQGLPTIAEEAEEPGTTG